LNPRQFLFYTNRLKERKVELEKTIWRHAEILIYETGRSGEEKIKEL